MSTSIPSNPVPQQPASIFGQRTDATALHNDFARILSHVMLGVCILFTVLILALLVVVTGYLVSLGFANLHWSFFTRDTIPIGMDGAPGGMRHALVGTLILIVMASVIGVPIGMATGVFLSEYESGSWIAKPVRFICDVLAGVPSIVVGILGFQLLVAPFGSGFFKNVPYFRDIQGFNAWAGAGALAFIMVPIIARTTEEMLRLVPGSYREASIALGASKARTILRVVIPSATSSIVTGVMLAVARVAGETAPLLFTASASNYLPFDYDSHFPYLHDVNLNGPFPSLTVQVFHDATSSYKDLNNLAWSGILVLIVLIFCINLSVRYVTRTRRTRPRA
jgi:phosphate transport system permease protein